jgi:hypothetical protein
MTTLTPPKPDTDDLSELDFAPKCEVEEVLMSWDSKVVDSRKCARTATYIGRQPCCDHRALACDQHVNDGKQWYCGICRTSVPSYAMSWTHL